MEPMKNYPITFSGRSHRGMVREKNEDSFVAFRIPEDGTSGLGIRAVLAVADGMGGHVGGDVASNAAMGFVEDIFDSKHQTMLSRFAGDLNGAITAIIEGANSRVKKIGSGEKKAPGTTFTGAFIVDNRAYIGHVGDSRAYHIRNDEIIPITEDHSYVARLIKDGKLTEESAKKFPQKNVLLKSLGAGDSLEIDPPYRVPLIEGDVILLCTDGLWDLVTGKEMVSILHGERSVKKACERLIELANSRGGHDNITVVIAEFGKLKRNPALAGRVAEAPKTSTGFGKKWVRALLYGILALLVVAFGFIVWHIIRPYIMEETASTRVNEGSSSAVARLENQFLPVIGSKIDA